MNDLNKALSDIQEKLNRRRGPGFLSLLGLLFIGLKLGGAISWSWWWVLAPFWAPVVILLLALIVAVGYVVWKIKREAKAKENLSS